MNILAMITLVFYAVMLIIGITFLVIKVVERQKEKKIEEVEMKDYKKY